MPSSVIDIDPEGEVVIIIPPSKLDVMGEVTAKTTAINPLNEVENEDGISSPTVSQPSDGRSEEDRWDKNEQHSARQLRVSKKHLIMASGRAKKMYQMDCKESQPDYEGFFHWKFEPIFNGMTFEIVMNIIHGHTQKVPANVTLDIIAEVAAITDDLQCHHAVKFVTDTWIDRIQKTLPQEICPDLYKWILVASVFRKPDIFQSTTHLAIMQCTDYVSPGGIPIYPTIIDAIETRRMELLRELIVGIEQIVDRLRQGHSTCTFECRSMLLGALIQEITSARLFSPDSLQPSSDLSLASALRTVRNFKSPAIYSSQSNFGDVEDGHENCDPSTLWKLRRETDVDEYGCSYSKRGKSKRRNLSTSEMWENPITQCYPETLFRHQCSTSRLLEPFLQTVEAKVKGLDLSDFSRVC